MAILDAFLDGITGAGLFEKLTWPGAPTEFIDQRGPQEFNAREAAAKFYIQRLFRVAARNHVRRPIDFQLKLRSQATTAGMVFVLTQLVTKGVITSAHLRNLTLAAEQGDGHSN